ncbi:MAG: hypothetical protein ACTSUK_05850 [Promethearchaeota archaeon]
MAPNIKVYLDPKFKKPVKEIDIGSLIAGKEKYIDIWIRNEGDADLLNMHIKFDKKTPLNLQFEKKPPTKLKAGETWHGKLIWKSHKKDRGIKKAEIHITGIYY